VPDLPSRDGCVTAGCPVCGGAVPSSRSDRAYCSQACRQRAYRRRHRPDPNRSAVPPIPVAVTAVRVYECPGCGERLAGQRRCDECNLYARRIGTGGHCPACGDIVTVQELMEGAIG